MRMNKSKRVKKAARVKKLSRFTVASRVAAILLVMTGLVAAAMLIAGRERSAAAAVETQPERATANKVSAPAPKMRSAPAAPAATFAADMTGTSAPMELAAKPPAPASAAVTITGCLERDDDTFRLEKTSGEDAPKSRSWKSGFLKKRPASIEVIDATNRLQLPNQVGRRVSVMGVLVDREMQARSLQRVAASCDN